MKTKIFSLFILLAVLLSCLVSCGQSDYYKSDSYYSDNGASIEKAEGSLDGDVVSGAENNVNVSDNRKIIETVNMVVETKTFDELVKSVEAKIAEMGGYIEKSSYSGSGENYYDNRSASLTVRVPANTTDKFTGFVSENSNVTQKSTTTDDVTLKYVDMESRVKALETEKAAYEELLAKAESVEEIVTVRQSLTDVIYEIESYKSQLRTYDDLVSYSTINIDICEVEQETVVEKQSTWQQIKTNLKNNFKDVWEGLVAFFVFLVSAIPYLLVLAVIAGIVLTIVFLSIHHSKKKKAKAKKEDNE